VLVERERVPEEADTVVRRDEGQRARGEPDARDRVEHADELDLDVGRERALEVPAEVEALGVLARVQLVRGADRLLVPRREQADLLQHARERADGVRAAREAEEADLVADGI
jgi:hypothetical protein